MSNGMNGLITGAKLTVSQDTAIAVEAFVRCGYTLADFVERRGNFQRNLYPLNALGVNAMAHALYIGVEIAKTPEEKVRDYYVKINASIADHQYAYDLGVRLGITKTLDLLGIKIEGVNA